MVGRLGRACTALHYTHYVHTHAQETPQCLLFLFLSSSCSVFMVDLDMVFFADMGSVLTKHLRAKYGDM